MLWVDLVEVNFRMVRNCKHFTKKEIEFIKNNYHKLGAIATSVILKRSIHSIRNKAYRMKIKYKPILKSKSYCTKCGKEINKYSNSLTHSGGLTW